MLINCFLPDAGFSPVGALGWIKNKPEIYILRAAAMFAAKSIQPTRMTATLEYSSGHLKNEQCSDALPNYHGCFDFLLVGDHCWVGRVTVVWKKGPPLPGVKCPLLSVTCCLILTLVPF